MRNTFLDIKNSLLELAKRSTDTTDSCGQEEREAEGNFYREWVQCGHQVGCEIKAVQLVARLLLQRSYAVYVVEVRSDVAQFEVRKRYSEFEQFYERCQRHAALSAAFPPRTPFRTGCSEHVTAKRLLQLNILLREITSTSNSGLQFELFSFLGLYDQCGHAQLRPKQSSLIATEEFLLQELARLNQNPANTLEGLQRIQLSLADRKKRLGLEVARQLLVGGEELEGVLPLVMGSANELVVREGLQLLNWLLSAETNRDWEVFRRALGRCPAEKLIMEREEVRASCEVGGEYFKLLSCYLSGRREEDLRQVARCYSESLRFQQQYLRWAKYNGLSSF